MDARPDARREYDNMGALFVSCIDSASDLQACLSAPRPKKPKAQPFVPKGKPRRKPKKEMSFFVKLKAHRDRFFG